MIRKVFFFNRLLCVRTRESLCLRARCFSRAAQSARCMGARYIGGIVERVSVVLNNGLESIAPTRSMILPIFLEIAFFASFQTIISETKSVVEDINVQSELNFYHLFVFVIRGHILYIRNNSEETKFLLGTFTLKLFCVRQYCRYYLLYEIASGIYSTATEPDLAQPLNFGFVFRIYSFAQWVKTLGTINMAIAVGPKPNLRKAFL